MIDVVPAEPWMAAQMQLQAAQISTGQAMSHDSIRMAMRGGMALAAVTDGAVIGMAGIFERWTDVGLAWALLSDDFARHKFTVFKIMKRAIDASPLHRIEANVVVGHTEGERLLAHLGFAKEGLMRKYWQGRDHSLFALVR